MLVLVPAADMVGIVVVGELATVDLLLYLDDIPRRRASAFLSALSAFALLRSFFVRPRAFNRRESSALLTRRWSRKRDIAVVSPLFTQCRSNVCNV